MGDTVLNGLLVASTINDGGVVLRDGHLVAGTQHLQRSLFQLQSLLLADNHATGQCGNILEHGLTTVAKARSLDSTDLQTATQTVDDECGQSLRVYVLSDDEQGTSALGCRLQDGQEVLDIGNLLVIDENIGVLHDALHLLRVGDEIAREIATIELHTLNNSDVGVAALRLLNSDDTVFRNLAHGIGQQLTNLLVVVGTDGGHLLYLVIVVIDLLSRLLNEIYNSLDSLVDTTLQIHWVGTGGNILQALGNDGLCQDGSSSRTVTSVVASLGGYALHQLGTGILEFVFQLDFLGYGHAVLGNLGSTELLLDDDITTLGAQCHLHCISQLIHAVLQQVAGFYIEFNIFCHNIFILQFYNSLLLDDCQHITLTHHQILLALELQFCATVLAIQHFVASLQNHLFVFCALANSLDGAVQGFLLGSVRNDDTTDFLFSRCRQYQHAVS